MHVRKRRAVVDETDFIGSRVEVGERVESGRADPELAEHMQEQERRVQVTDLAKREENFLTDPGPCPKGEEINLGVEENQIIDPRLDLELCGRDV